MAHISLKEIEEEIKSGANQIKEQIEKNKVPIEGFTIEEACKYQQLIENFVQHIVRHLPGILGKVAGTLILDATKDWFAHNCKQPG